MTAYLDNIEGFEVKAGQRTIRPTSLLKSQLSVDFSHILLTGEGKVLGLNDSAIYVLSLHLSHLLFILNAKELTHELWIDCYDLYQLVPQLKYLTAY